MTQGERVLEASSLQNLHVCKQLCVRRASSQSTPSILLSIAKRPRATFVHDLTNLCHTSVPHFRSYAGAGKETLLGALV